MRRADGVLVQRPMRIAEAKLQEERLAAGNLVEEFVELLQHLFALARLLDVVQPPGEGSQLSLFKRPQDLGLAGAVPVQVKRAASHAGEIAVPTRRISG